MNAKDRPAHYNVGEVECIDGIRSALGPDGFRAFCRGAAIKYLWRAGRKHDGEDDLRKAIDYTRWALGGEPREYLAAQVVGAPSEDMARAILADGVKGSPETDLCGGTYPGPAMDVNDGAVICELHEGHSGRHMADRAVWIEPLRWPAEEVAPHIIRDETVMKRNAETSDGQPRCQVQSDNGRQCLNEREHIGAHMIDPPGAVERCSNRHPVNGRQCGRDTGHTSSHGIDIGLHAGDRWALDGSVTAIGYVPPTLCGVVSLAKGRPCSLPVDHKSKHCLKTDGRKYRWDR